MIPSTALRFGSAVRRTLALLGLFVIVLFMAACDTPLSADAEDGQEQGTAEDTAPGDTPADDPVDSVPTPASRVVAWEPAAADGVWKGWTELTEAGAGWTGTIELTTSGMTRFHVHVHDNAGTLTGAGYLMYQVSDASAPVTHEFTIADLQIDPVENLAGAVQGRALDLTRYANAIAGSGGTAGSSDGNFQNGTTLRSPFGVTTDGRNLFITDFGNETIRRMDIATGEVITLSGSAGSAGFVDAVVGADARFDRPRGITYHQGVLYVVDGHRSEGPGTRVRMVDPATGATATLIPPTSDIIDATDLVVAVDHLYVTDFWGNTVYRYHLINESLELFAGQVTNNGAGGIDGSDGTDGIGSQATFRNPWGITFDGGYLFVVDTNDNAVRRIDPITAEVTTIIRTDTQSYLFNPTGITTDGDRLYVSDMGDNRIREIALDANRDFSSITDVAGSEGVAGTNWGTGQAATFGDPVGITTDGINLYLADRHFHIIRKIQ
ncbi:MAG: hypothetical protein ACOC0O_04965 [Spirochaetota bacterium]